MGGSVCVCGFVCRRSWSVTRDTGLCRTRFQRRQRPGSVFACDSLSTQMATSSSCPRRYSSMKIIIKDVHTAQLQIRTHSSLISQQRRNTDATQTIHINPSGWEPLAGVISHGIERLPLPVIFIHGTRNGRQWES